MDAMAHKGTAGGIETHGQRAGGKQTSESPEDGMG